MKPTSLSDLIRPFLETRAPLLFLIGSLALALLTNAVYELLTTTLGVTPVFLIGLILTTTVLLIAATLGFLRILRVIERRQIRVRNHIPAEQQAAPHAGLILPVGMRNDGPELAIIQWHLRNATLRHCWLLITPEVEQKAKFGDLKQLLHENNVRIHPISLSDAIQSDQVYTLVRTAINEAKQIGEALPLIADITGGTKPMTAGTLLACQDEATAVQYWSTPRDEHGNPRLVEEGRPMRVMLQPAFEEIPVQ
ncbi:MAG: hypothetical protein AB4911_05925 [Oscillochloridaceae bacterium umkhey_bin13]